MRIKSAYLYLFLVLWIGILGILVKSTDFNVTGLGITLTFLTMIFTPGILLWSLIGIDSNNLAVKLLYTIGLGFGFYFILNLLAIVLNLTLFQLITISLILILVLWIIAFWRDRENPPASGWEINFSWVKNQSKGDWVFFGFIILSAVIAFLTIDAQSDKLLGDGWFHLAILRKITSGNGLNPYNLWVTKTTSLNPVYSFPIWHILVGELALILNIPIFTALRQILLPLAIITMIVWWSFLKVIFRSKYLAGLGFLSFLLIFLKDNNFQYLLPLASPDTFNRLLLLPLILVITIEFLLNHEALRKKQIFNVVFIVLLSIFLGLIHFTQLIYFVGTLIILIILTMIFQPNRQIIVKGLWLLGSLLVIILVYLILSQGNFINSFLKANAASFTGDPVNFSTYLGANIIYRYAILSLPILWLFSKKQPRILILPAIIIAALMIYWPFLGLRWYFYKYFGEIFVDRALASVPHFVYFGFLLFLVIILIEKFVSQKGKNLGLIVSSLLLLVIASMIFPLTRTIGSQLVNSYLFSETFNLSTNFFPILFGIIFIAVVLYYFFRQKAVNLATPENKSIFALLVIVAILFLSLPYQTNFQKVLAKNPNGSFFSKRLTTDASDIRSIGGQKTIDFLNSVPPGSVFLTSNPTMSQMVLLYSNNLAAEYPYGVKELLITKSFFDPQVESSERLAILDQTQTNYIVIQKSAYQEIFTSLPDYFGKVFENKIQYETTDANHEKQTKSVSILVYEYLK